MSGLPDDEVTSTPDLRRVLHRVARGDVEAFAVLFDALGPSVGHMAHMVLDGRADAGEVVRATLLELWRRAPDPDLTEGLPVEAWALSRAHHHAVALRALAS